MKVAHRDDYDTHAVIGGQGVQEFGIAQTAEFFTVLSNTLYSNKPLAVIREVLCNAWDSHIVSGIQHLPVKVDINEDSITIRDYGAGIPHHLIHAIYCVYGNSTKENDGNQTGGFGLGSKAPFAYSDHFTVSNHHAGTKTVHAISRGSALTQGKPDRRVMVTVPTTETGVEVMIPIKVAIDVPAFIKIANDIAAFGEMNVLLNGRHVDVVPISTGECNMFLTTRAPAGSHNKLNVRYGNVIYPIQPDPEYQGVYQRLMEIIKDIPSRNETDWSNVENDFVLIMQAPANSISVTPSRESISNTETTIKTIRDLMGALIAHMQGSRANWERKLFDEQEKALSFMVNAGYEDRVFFTSNLLNDEFGPKVLHPGSNVWTQITSMIGLADYYLRFKKKISTEFQLKMQYERVKLMYARDYRRKPILWHYLRIMKDGAGKHVRRRHHTYPDTSQDFYDAVVRPIIRKVASNPVLNPKFLNWVSPPHRSSLTRMGWQTIDKIIPNTDMMLLYCESVVVVTHSKRAYEEDWEALADRHKFPKEVQRLVYVAPRVKGHKEAAIAHFEKMGYFVIDYVSFYEAHKDDNKPTPIEKKALYLATPKPRNTGLVSLAYNAEMDTKKNQFHVSAHAIEGSPRITDYDYIVRPTNLSDKYHRRFFPWGDVSAYWIGKTYGAKIGIVVNEPQYLSQKKKGKTDGFLWIAQQIAGEVMNRPEIRAYVEAKMGMDAMSTPHMNFIEEVGKYSSVLQNLITIPGLPPNDNLIFYNVLMNMVSGHQFGRHSSRPADDTWQQPLWDAKQYIDSWKASTVYAEIDAKISNSRGLKLLDLENMKRALRRLDKINPDYSVKVFIETAIVNALKF